jgi:hypothetical protein
MIALSRSRNSPLAKIMHRGTLEVLVAEGGAAWQTIRQAPADLGEESQITAVRDPDGNLVELTQLGPGWLGHLKANRAEGNDLVSAWGARLGGPIR